MGTPGRARMAPIGLAARRSSRPCAPIGCFSCPSDECRFLFGCGTSGVGLPAAPVGVTWARWRRGGLWDAGGWMGVTGMTGSGAGGPGGRRGVVRCENAPRCRGSGPGCSPSRAVPGRRSPREHRRWLQPSLPPPGPFPCFPPRVSAEAERGDQPWLRLVGCPCGAELPAGIGGPGWAMAPAAAASPGAGLTPRHPDPWDPAELLPSPAAAALSPCPAASAASQRFPLPWC